MQFHKFEFNEKNSNSPQILNSLTVLQRSHNTHQGGSHDIRESAGTSSFSFFCSLEELLLEFSHGFVKLNIGPPPSGFLTDSQTMNKKHSVLVHNILNSWSSASKTEAANRRNNLTNLQFWFFCGWIVHSPFSLFPTTYWTAFCFWQRKNRWQMAISELPSLWNIAALHLSLSCPLVLARAGALHTVQSRCPKCVFFSDYLLNLKNSNWNLVSQHLFDGSNIFVMTSPTKHKARCRCSFSGLRCWVTFLNAWLLGSPAKQGLQLLPKMAWTAAVHNQTYRMIGHLQQNYPGPHHIWNQVRTYWADNQGNCYWSGQNTENNGCCQQDNSNLFFNRLSVLCHATVLSGSLHK